METVDKEVDFHRNCKTCKHKNVQETESPCDECLEEPVNSYSSKPVKWEEKKK